MDIGGTNTVWGLVDPQGKVLERGRWSTRSHSDAASFVRQATDSLKQLLQQQPAYELVGIGIGAPNGNYFKGTIENAPNLQWKGIVPLKALFQQYFDVAIWVTNDANAAAIGEQQFGVAKGQNDFVMVTLGTGLGSGFVVNGELVYGHDGFAGELGHTIVERGGRLVGCGRRGCLETYAWCAEQGDALALEIFDYTAQILGFSLANTVAISSPSLIVLFGGLANAGHLLLTPTQRYMEANMLNLFRNKVVLALSTVSENDAAVLGAAALVWKAL